MFLVLLKIKAKVYFDNDNNNLIPQSATLFLNGRFYLSTIEENLYKRKIPYKVYNGNNTLDISYSDISYKTIVKTIKNKPSWYKNQVASDSEYYYGYGLSITNQDEAKANARTNLAENMGGSWNVKQSIKSKVTIRQNSKNNENINREVSNRSNQSINTKIKDIHLYKEDYLDEVYFYSYKKQK